MAFLGTHNCSMHLDLCSNPKKLGSEPLLLLSTALHTVSFTQLLR